MITYNLLKLGNPLLRKTSDPIDQKEFNTPHLKILADTLFHALEIEKGVGLAAPQIGINKRAIVFGMNKHPVFTKIPKIPFTILFNPSYEPISELCVEEYEGCLSVGVLRAKVSRYKTIVYRGYDIEGRLIEREVSDLHARVVQHECDHLEGIIFLDKISDHHTMGFPEELAAAGLLPSME